MTTVLHSVLYLQVMIGRLPSLQKLICHLFHITIMTKVNDTDQFKNNAVKLLLNNINSILIIQS